MLPDVSRCFEIRSTLVYFTKNGKILQHFWFYVVKNWGKNMNFQSPMKCCQMFQGVLKFGQPSFILQKCQCQGHTEFNTSCNCRSNVQLCYLLDWYLSEFSVWFRFLTARDRGNVGKCTHGKIYKNVLISYWLTFLTMMTIV